MDNFETRLLIIIISYLLSAVSLISVPVRSKLLSKKLGKILVKTSERKLTSQIAVAAVCLVLNSMLFFRDLGFVYNILIASVSFMGVFISTKEFIFFKKYGLWEKALINCGKLIFMEEIYSIPLFNLDEPEETKFITQGFDVVLENGKTLTMQFNTIEECKDILTNLKKIGSVCIKCCL